MADIKWSAFPSIGALATGDILVGLRAGANVRFSSLTIPWTVANGGTGLSTLSTYTLLAGGTTATGNLQQVSAGTSGQLLQSNGAGALPTWTTATYPAATTINQILYSSSNNVVSGITTSAGALIATDSSGVPVAFANPGATGKLLSSVNGDLPQWTTATFPTGSGTLNHMLRSDGTNWVQTTNTTLSSADVLAGITSATIGDINIAGSTLITTGTNEDLFINPNGTGRTIFDTTTNFASSISVQVASISSNADLVLGTFSATSSNGSVFYMYKSASTTVGSFSAVSNGDVIGFLTARGDDGTQFTNSSAIQFVVSGAVSTGIVPGAMNLQTCTTGGVLTTALTLSNSQAATFANTVTATAGAFISGATGGGFSGAFTAYSTGASLGSLTTQCANNAGNYANVLTNSSTSAARTWTLPDATGTIALTSGASGIVNSGSQNQLAWYAANGTTVSGLSTANNGILVTSAGGVPSISNTVGADLTINGVPVGAGGGSVSTNVRLGTSLSNGSTSGNNAVAIGASAMTAAYSGTGTIAIGGSSGAACVSCDANVLIGYIAANSLNTGDNNTCIGSRAGSNAASGSASLTSGSNNTLIGFNASANNAAAAGVLALGSDAVADIATGATSGDNGPGISIGSASQIVGFRGDGSIYPSAGASAGYWRVKINGTYYKILLMADA